MKSRFLLTEEAEHHFNLEIMEFPIGVCSIEIRWSGYKNEVLLPITLTRFIAL